MNRPFELDLGGLDWRLSAVDDDRDGLQGLPAAVPGCVHADLLAAGVIADPFHGDGEAECAWVDQADWEYRASFDLPEPAGSRWFLEFDGLQTVATVLVNGIEAGAAENMLRRHRFDATAALHGGANELVVRFRSSAQVMRERAAADGADLPYDWAHPYNRLRVMASSVGWDWGPTLVGAGIWRPARLREVTGDRLEVAMTTRLDGDLASGALLLDVTIDAASETDEEPRTLEVTLGETAWTVEAYPGRASLELPVEHPALWWPHGHGEPVTHPVSVALRDGDQIVTGRVGFRSVKLENEPDRFGRSFRLMVNGRPLFVRGVNWIPDDTLIARVDDERHASRIAAAQDANIGLLRVWGGGVYESDAFYRLCDERGLLIWQDFAFACAAYPEDEPLRSEVLAEAQDAVARLAEHPSVVVWCGGNEAELGWHDWGWRERLGGRPWGEAYYRRYLPEIVTAGAPGAVYVPGTPVSLTPGAHPNAPGDGTVHLWDPWNRLDYAHYRDDIPRFAAEFGFQAPANWSTLADALGADPDPTSPAMAARQKQPGGMRHLVDRLATRFPDTARIATDPARWHAATQLNQAHAIRTAVEHFRSWWPRTAGSIVWQFNDTWPALSWSVLDAAGGRKLGWYALRRAYADRLVTVQSREEGLSVLLVNDTDAEWAGQALARRAGVSGGELARAELPFVVPPRSVVALPLPPALILPSERRDELLVVDAGEPIADGSHRAVHAFVSDDGIRWPRPELAVTTEADPAVPGTVAVRVTAGAAVTDLSLLADRVDPGAVVDSALVTLLAGESHTFRVRCARPLDADRLTGWPTLISRSAFFHEPFVDEPGR